MEEHTDSNRAQDIQSSAQAQLDELRDRMQDLSERLSGFIRERPGTSIAIALGAGFLIGRLLRS